MSAVSGLALHWGSPLHSSFAGKDLFSPRLGRQEEFPPPSLPLVSIWEETPLVKLELLPTRPRSLRLCTEYRFSLVLPCTSSLGSFSASCALYYSDSAVERGHAYRQVWRSLFQVSSQYTNK
ncbi:hypothetical protein COCON_G00162580 [Conger conger]|uniref:Uncharacterized protein n=1 Tax=Conger conger TaxID=82655 RepID=A0A9Q1D6W1_CONCO|nr:hypothetical protein COCON_G00162580 [Conger conger]